MPHNPHFEEKFALIFKETEICRKLSSNDASVRRKGVTELKHLLKNIDDRKTVDSTDFSRLWSGIFNFIWMSDKPLVQEADVESISKLIHVLKKHEMLFVRGFFNSLTSQWNRISHFRTDKFLMMVRRFLRQILFFLKNSQWNSHKMESFSQELYSAIQTLPLALVLHFNDIYIEEIAKVSEGIIPTDALILLLKGYVECIVTMKPSMNIVNNINSTVFSALTRQLKLHIKQKAVLAAEGVQEDEVEVPENRALDPRPGNVDVHLPFIEFDEKKIVEFLVKYEKGFLPSKARNVLLQILNMFKSITNLRETIVDPKKVESEGKTNKRKKRHKRFGSLVKKSCKRLEMFEAESDVTAEDRKMFKKLQKMTDLIRCQTRTRKKSSKKLEFKCEDVSMPEVTEKTEDNRQILTSDSPAWVTVPKDELVSWLPKDEKEKDAEMEESDEDVVDCDISSLFPSPPRVTAAKRRRSSRPAVLDPIKKLPTDEKEKDAEMEESDEDDVDYDISSLFPSPPQVAGVKRRRSSRPVVLEVKRSARLANKAAAAKIAEDKKVAFTQSNSFQEVREYYSTLRSSPKNPYDASRTPVKGILKPFAVPGPINPFYFPNGQPKLLNLRKQRMQRFL